MTDYQKICAQLQIQRNQFADAHATAAARAETLAEALDRVKVEKLAECTELENEIARQEGLVEHLRMVIADHKAKIAELEKPQMEMLQVTIDDQEETPF